MKLAQWPSKKRGQHLNFSKNNYDSIGVIRASTIGDVSLLLEVPCRIFFSWKREKEEREGCLPLAKG
jgi:hypothetical protein